MDEPFTNCSELAKVREVRPFDVQCFNLRTVVLNRWLERGTVAFDEWIAGAETVLLSCPRCHPGRPHLLLCLANEKIYRYDTVSRHKSDLDDIIACLTEALLFPFHISNCAGRFDYVGALYLFACALVRRYKCTLQPSDLEYGIICFRRLLYLPLRTTDIRFSSVSAELADALSYKTEIDLDSEPRNIEEVLTLYLSCLPWDPLERRTAAVLVRLTLAVTSRLSRTGRSERFEEVVGYLYEGRKVCLSDDLPELSILLAFALTWQMTYTNSANDVQEIMTLFNENIPFLPPGHYILPLAQISMGQLVISQSVGGDSSDRLVEAINFCRASLNCLPPGPQYRPMALHVLAALLRERYDYFGDEDSLKEAELCTEEVYNLCESEELQSLRYTDNGPTGSVLSHIHASASAAGLEKEIRRSNDRLAVTQPYDSRYRRVLLDQELLYMSKYAHSNSLEYLEEVIKCRKVLLSSTPNTHRVAIDMASGIQLAFTWSGQEESLNKSIDMCRSVLEVQPQKPSRFKLFKILGTNLSFRCLQFGRLENVDESVTMLKAAFDEDYADASDRVYVAWWWASTARYFRHPSTEVAYQNGLSVMQSPLAVGPTVQTQHAILGSQGPRIRMPLEYASYLIEKGQLECAIETLEQGRALLWSEMRGLRTSVDQLDRVNPTLADRFLAISKDIEAVAMSLSPLSSSHEDRAGHNDAAGGHDETDAFTRMLQEQRMLMQERQAITSQIREIPGCEHFLKAVSFDTLRRAASGGPIIIINHCRWGCDIIIVLHDAPSSLIPTSRLFYHRAVALEKSLLDARKRYALESREYNKVLRSVLEELYELVGRPVIDRLQELRVPRQSRVWWCPTSVFCSLPLHAMGPIPLDDNKKRYFSDLYVTSYTPTLGALIASRESAVQMTDLSPLTPSLLVVAQPDEYLRGVKQELKVLRAIGIPVTSLVSAEATRATVIEGLQKHQLVHFACHGTLKPGKPFDAAFELHGGDRLALLDIIRSRLSIAEFAFLSACHTAELTDVENPDEALHLTAAMQYSGSRSVVGTMWAMADTDGRDLAEHFYGNMLSPNGDNVGSLCERSARALQGAVQRLRNKKGVTLERRVNFVHYGV